MPGKKKVCFYCKIRSLEALKFAEFYNQDLDILSDLGYDVSIVIDPRKLVKADIYFIWWWTSAFIPVALAKIVHAPSIITGVFDEWAFSSRNTMHQKLMAWGMRQADANIFVSDLEYKSLTQKFALKNSYLSQLSVNCDIYKPNPKDQREKFILSVSWLTAGNANRKGVPESIQAFARIAPKFPEYKFLIAGEKYSGVEQLEQLIASLNLQNRVELLGSITKEEKISYMQRCAIYLQPSKFEGFGLAILEAMSCGAPVIVCPVGAVPEVAGNTGIYVSQDSSAMPAAIAAELEKLISDDRMRQELGEAARARALAQFSYQRRKNEIKEIIAKQFVKKASY